MSRARSFASLAIATLAALGAPRAAHAQDCAGGRVASDATEWHCCWPDQRWGQAERACIGPPACPSGLVAHGEQCVAPRVTGGATIVPLGPAVQGGAAIAPQPVEVAQPLAVAQPAVDPRAVPEGAAGWPSSSMPPTSDVNPRYERSPTDPGLVAAGLTTFLIGYVSSALFSIVPFTDQGTYVVEGFGYSGSSQDYDATCHDTMAGMQLIPVLGPLIAIVVNETCTVREYRRVEDMRGNLIGYTPTGRDRRTSEGYMYAWNVPNLVLQLVGGSLLVAGLASTHQELRVGGSDRGAHVSLHPYAPGAQSGLSLEVTW